MEKTNHPRQVESIVVGRATTDGAGVNLTRVLTQPFQKRLDPFLMLDVFKSDNPEDYIAGFPDHPHRGFETVTYMLAGRMRHRDSAGHEGLLQSGDVQWMTAGRGVIHSEIPEQESGVMEGFQLWLNLPSKMKMTEPWYRDIRGEDIPSYVTKDGVRVKVIAGTSDGIEGAVKRDDTEPVFIDIDLPSSSVFSTSLSSAHNAFIYVYRGQAKIGDQLVAEGRMAILGNGPDFDGVSMEAGEPARAILVAGKPLNEPIVQYGPFVMNTQAEIYQAIGDFREGRLG